MRRVGGESHRGRDTHGTPAGGRRYVPVRGNVIPELWTGARADIERKEQRKRDILRSESDEGSPVHRTGKSLVHRTYPPVHQRSFASLRID